MRELPYYSVTFIIHFEVRELIDWIPKLQLQFGRSQKFFPRSQICTKTQMSQRKVTAFLRESTSPNDRSSAKHLSHRPNSHPSVKKGKTSWAQTNSTRNSNKHGRFCCSTTKVSSLVCNLRGFSRNENLAGDWLTLCILVKFNTVLKLFVKFWNHLETSRQFWNHLAGKFEIIWKYADSFKAFRNFLKSSGNIRPALRLWDAVSDSVHNAVSTC